MTERTVSRNAFSVSRRQALGLVGASAVAAMLPGSAHAADKATLAWTPGLATPQIPLALQNKLWTSENLDVDTVAFSSGRETLEALLGGGADFATLSEFPATTAALQGQKFMVLANLSVFTDNKVIINRKSGIRDAKSLAGKKVGVTMGASLQFAAETFIDEQGVDVEYINVAPGDLVPALARGEIDAAFMFDGFFKQARDVLGADYLEIPTPSYQTHFIIGARTEFVQKSPEAVKSFIAGLLAAQNMVRDKAKTIEAVSASTEGTFTAQAVEALWPFFDFRVALTPDITRLMLAEGKWMNKKGLVPTPATEELIRSHVADSFLKELAPASVSL
jgi:NitT/TauT family transport system substrate-binding protein